MQDKLIQSIDDKRGHICVVMMPRTAGRLLADVS